MSRRRYMVRQAADDALRDDVYRDGAIIGHVKGPYAAKRRVYEWKLLLVSPQHAPPFGRSGIWGEARTRRAAIARVIAADKKRRAVPEKHHGPEQLVFASILRTRRAARRARTRSRT